MSLSFIEKSDRSEGISQQGGIRIDLPSQGYGLVLHTDMLSESIEGKGVHFLKTKTKRKRKDCQRNRYEGKEFPSISRLYHPINITPSSSDFSVSQHASTKH